MIVYFDTSALVPIVIEEDASVTVTRLWLEAYRMVSSRLISVEAHAAAALAETFGLRGHDACHLASAELLADGDLVVAAGDRALVRAARALGLGVADLRHT